MRVQAETLIVCLSAIQALAQNSTLSPSAGYALPHGFRSAYFGFSYTVSDKLVPNTREVELRLMREHVFLSPDASVLLFSAFDPNSNPRTRRGVTVLATSRSLYPGASDARPYLKKLNNSLTSRGWTVVRDSDAQNIAGHEFLRSDYLHGGVYQSSVCSILNGYVLNFVLTGGSEEDIRDLAKSVDNLQFETSSLSLRDKLLFLGGAIACFLMAALFRSSWLRGRGKAEYGVRGLLFGRILLALSGLLLLYEAYWPG